MPQLNLTLVTAPSATLSAQAIAGLTQLTADLLGKRAEVTAIGVHYVDAVHWGIAGQPLLAKGERAFYLEVLVTAGTNISSEYRAYLAAAHALLDGLLGGVNPASYVAIREVRADAWGYGGVTQEGRRLGREAGGMNG